MKKTVVVLLMVFSWLPLQSARLMLYYKDKQNIDYRAESVWTRYDYKQEYKKYFEVDDNIYEVNYYVQDGTVTDRWCLSVPYAELDSIYIIANDEVTPYCVFKNGNQYGK